MVLFYNNATITTGIAKYGIFTNFLTIDTFFLSRFIPMLK